jgi:diaminopimelate decarboxylase
MTYPITRLSLEELDKAKAKVSTRFGRDSKYPFEALAIGDGFTVPYAGEDPRKVRARVAATCSQRRKRLGMEISVICTEAGVLAFRTA